MSVHCEHGTYIGHPGGPDYLCGWCEDGIPLDKFRQIMAEQTMRNALDRARRRIIVVCLLESLSNDRLPPFAYSARMANILVNELWDQPVADVDAYNGVLAECRRLGINVPTHHHHIEV